MTWKLWLDDQINDPDCPARHAPEGFKGAASVKEAQALVLEFGPPDFMDLDADMGSLSTGLPADDAGVFLSWLDNFINGIDEEEDLDLGCMPLRPPPAWNIHSENPVAKKNLEAFLSSWKRMADDSTKLK